jgi:hypothetical protein
MIIKGNLSISPSIALNLSATSVKSSWSTPKAKAPNQTPKSYSEAYKAFHPKSAL